MCKTYRLLSIRRQVIKSFRIRSNDTCNHYVSYCNSLLWSFLLSAPGYWTAVFSFNFRTWWYIYGCIFSIESKIFYTATTSIFNAWHYYSITISTWSRFYSSRRGNEKYSPIWSKCQWIASIISTTQTVWFWRFNQRQYSQHINWYSAHYGSWNFYCKLIWSKSWYMGSWMCFLRTFYKRVIIRLIELFSIN